MLLPCIFVYPFVNQWNHLAHLETTPNLIVERTLTFQGIIVLILLEKTQDSCASDWCPGADLNHRHEDFQSTALPLSYPGTGERFERSGARCSKLGPVRCPVVNTS